MRDFPEGFTFGTSAAAHQVEGGNVNNDWWAGSTPRHSGVSSPRGDAFDSVTARREDAALVAASV